MLSKLYYLYNIAFCKKKKGESYYEKKAPHPFMDGCFKKMLVISLK
jgi:hypothetical protein